MTAITDDMLIAYVDGELPEPQRALVEGAVAADPALFEKLEQHRRFRARMFAASTSRSGTGSSSTPAKAPNTRALKRRCCSSFSNRAGSLATALSP